MELYSVNIFEFADNLSVVGNWLLAFGVVALFSVVVLFPIWYVIKKAIEKACGND